MSGEELFQLKKADLIKYCGKEEGHRLDSQLTLQRKHSGVRFFLFLIKWHKHILLIIFLFQYQTTRSSELLEALKR